MTRLYRNPIAILVGALIAMTSLAACEPRPHDMPDGGGTCCLFTGPVAHDCAAIEKLGSGADLDGRCNQVNQGQSCSWNYANKECCKIAVGDGFGSVTCGDGGDSGKSGLCCLFTGPKAHDCASIEKLGAGADLDGRCNAVNQGQSCSWTYADNSCCQMAVNDGFPGNVDCP